MCSSCKDEKPSPARGFKIGYFISDYNNRFLFILHHLGITLSLQHCNFINPLTNPVHLIAFYPSIIIFTQNVNSLLYHYYCQLRYMHNALIGIKLFLSFHDFSSQFHTHIAICNTVRCSEIGKCILLLICIFEWGISLVMLLSLSPDCALQCEGCAEYPAATFHKGGRSNENCMW